MAPLYPNVPVTTGIEKQFRVVYFRPIAYPRYIYRISFIEEANIVGLAPISSDDLPQNKTLVNCRAKSPDPMIADLVQKYCVERCRAHRGWTMVAELKAKDLVHYFRGSITPVITILLERPIVQTALKTGGPRESLHEIFRLKLKTWNRHGSKSEEETAPDASDTRPLLERPMGF